MRRSPAYFENVVRPGSHAVADMPSAWPGHRYIICEHSSPNHNLSQDWSPACRGKLVVVSVENILCEHHLRTQSTPGRPFDPFFRGGMVEIALIQFVFAQILLHRRPIADAPGTSPTVVSCNRRLRPRYVEGLWEPVLACESWLVSVQSALLKQQAESRYVGLHEQTTSV